MNLARLITTHQSLAFGILLTVVLSYIAWLFWVFNTARKPRPHAELLAETPVDDVQQWPSDPAQRSG